MAAGLTAGVVQADTTGCSAVVPAAGSTIVGSDRLAPRISDDGAGNDNQPAINCERAAIDGRNNGYGADGPLRTDNPITDSRGARGGIEPHSAASAVRPAR